LRRGQPSSGREEREKGKVDFIIPQGNQGIIRGRSHWPRVKLEKIVLSSERGGGRGIGGREFLKIGSFGGMNGTNNGRNGFL